MQHLTLYPKHAGIIDWHFQITQKWNTATCLFPLDNKLVNCNFATETHYAKNKQTKNDDWYWLCNDVPFPHFLFLYFELNICFNIYCAKDKLLILLFCLRRLKLKVDQDHFQDLYWRKNYDIFWMKTLPYSRITFRMIRTSLTHTRPYVSF